MERVVYFLVIKPASYLPMSVLHLISNIMYLVVYRGLKYRVKVVRNNLKNSFPEKSGSELKKIEKQFYRHLCDMVVETVKLFSIRKKELSERLRITNPEVLDHIYDEGRSAILVLGHYNNWEMLGAAYNAQLKHQCVIIYAPVNNAYFGELFNRLRTMTGAEVVSARLVPRAFAGNKGKRTVTTFLSDQSPRDNKNNFWMEFLNQKTGVMQGAELFARKLNYPIVYGHIRKVKRGYYEFDLIPVHDQPKDTEEGYITYKYTKILEEHIKQEPAYWTWSHKRWKRECPVDNLLEFDIRD